MKPVEEVRALVVDHGLYIPLARKLAETYAEVIYWRPMSESFPTISKACVGDGYSNVTQVFDPWNVIDSKGIDLAIFPDVQHSQLQAHLQSLGLPVWGSQSADEIELSRYEFINALEELGLEVPEFKRILGLDDLRHYLSDHEDKYIKISRYRGTMETMHWRSLVEDECLLDNLAVALGPCRNRLWFYVFDPIDADLEDGVDTWCVNGQWPSLCLHGVEAKDQAYLGGVKPISELPDYTQEIMRKFGPILGKRGMVNFWSQEIRVAGDKAYFIDPTPRAPMPGLNSHLAIWRNLADVIWHGANGEILEPEFSAQYSSECALTVDDDEHCWFSAKIPDDIAPNVNLSNCCEIDGITAFPPGEIPGHIIGWLVATGDSPKEALESLAELSTQLPEKISANLSAVVKLTDEIENAKEAGIEVTAEPLPDANEIMEKA